MVEAAGGSESRVEGFSKGAKRLRLLDWHPRTIEDKLLHAYLADVGGRLYLEVPTGSPRGPGNWPPGSKIRRIDGMRIVSPVPAEALILPQTQYQIQELPNIFSSNTIELVEAKKKLNRLVIGQAVAGTDMFRRQYQADSVIPVILCIEGDPALEWVCEQRGIRVERLDGVYGS